MTGGQVPGVTDGVCNLFVIMFEHFLGYALQSGLVWLDLVTFEQGSDLEAVTNF